MVGSPSLRSFTFSCRMRRRIFSAKSTRSGWFSAPLDLAGMAATYPVSASIMRSTSVVPSDLRPASSDEAATNQSRHTIGKSLFSGGSTLRCGKSLPRPLTQLSHHGAYGRCVSSWSSRSTCDGGSGPTISIGWRARSGFLCRALWASTLLWYSSSASLSWSRAQSCALVPQTGADRCRNLFRMSEALLSSVSWPGGTSAGCGTEGLWKIVTIRSPTAGISADASSSWDQSTRSSTLIHWLSFLTQVVLRRYRERCGFGTWDTTAPCLTRTGSPPGVNPHPVFSDSLATSASGRADSAGTATSPDLCSLMPSPAWASSGSAISSSSCGSNPPTAQTTEPFQLGDLVRTGFSFLSFALTLVFSFILAFSFLLPL